MTGYEITSRESQPKRVNFFENSLESAAEWFDTGRREQPFKKGSYQGGEGSISEFNLSGDEKIGGKQTGSQFKISKFIRPIRTLQDGGFAPFKGVNGETGFHVQTRPDRCLMCSSVPTFNEVHSIRMIREPLRISMFMFWPKFFSPNIRKISTCTSSISAPDKYQAHSLPRRFSVVREDKRGDNNGTRHDDFSLTELWVCDKQGEISVRTFQKLEFLGLIFIYINLFYNKEGTRSGKIIKCL